MNKFAAMSAALVVMSLAGCSSAPKWARKGASALPKSEKVFYGVGEADASIASRTLRVEASENRARSDVQRYFDTYSGYLMREYDGSEGKMVERVIKTFSAGHLRGVRIEDRYERDDKVYSLAKLDLDEFKRVVAHSPELDEKMRRSLLERSEHLFDQLRKEETQQPRER